MLAAYVFFRTIGLWFKALGLICGGVLWLVFEAFVVEFLLLVAMMYVLYAPLVRLVEDRWPRFPYIPSLHRVGRVTFWV